MESNEVLTLRAMAWQRAKGELHAMLATYWPDPVLANDVQAAGSATALADMRLRIEAFIQDVEENL